MEKTKKKRNIVRLLLILFLVLVLLFCAGSMIAVRLMFNDNFQRGEISRYTTDLLYGDVKGEYARTPVSFYSGENRLQGYIYGEENDKGLVVLSHGLGGGQESYMAEIVWFVEHGWRVFAFDNTGSCESEGEGTVGLVQSALDLDAALTYIEQDGNLSKLKKVLYGHSWGGYAVGAVLNFDHDVAASVSVAGYCGPVDMTVEWGKDTLGGFVYAEYPFIWLTNKMIFGGYSDLSAVEGINRTAAPVLIIHGEGDAVVSCGGASIIARRDEITNPNAEYLTVSEPGRNGHNTLFHSAAALEYIRELSEEYQAMEDEWGGEVPDEANEEFFSKVDKARANELDGELFDTISRFFEKALAQEGSGPEEN